MLPDAATLLETTGRLVNAYNSSTVSSLSEYTKSTRITPIVLIDKRVMAADAKNLNSLLQTLLSVYTGWYLTAVNLTMSVGNVQVVNILNQFSTDQTLNSAVNRSWKESGGWGLLGLESIDEYTSSLPSYGIESFYNVLENWKLPKDIAADKKAAGNKAVDNDKAIHNIVDESNLAVGKLLDVKLVHGSDTISVPVVVAFNPKSIEPEDFIAISNEASAEKTMTGRYHAWRSGEISFIKDYLLCQDLLATDRKMLMADKTNSLLSIRSRETKGTLATLLTGHASPNKVSSIIIISKQTATDLELSIKGSLKSSHVRDKYFSNNSTMMLVVVDLRMERFIMYSRGIDHSSEYTFDDIKTNSNKPNGVDIESVIKAYNLGDSPRL